MLHPRRAFPLLDKFCFQHKCAWEVTQIKVVVVWQWKRSIKHLWISYECMHTSKSKPRSMGQKGPPRVSKSEVTVLMNQSLLVSFIWQFLYPAALLGHCLDCYPLTNTGFVIHFMVTSPMLFSRFIHGPVCITSFHTTARQNVQENEVPL